MAVCRPSPSSLLWQIAFVATITLNTLAFSAQSNHPDRRSAIGSIIIAAPSITIFATSFCNSRPARASVAPFAPVDTLLPATRVRLTIDRAVNIANNLMQEADSDKKQKMLTDLESLLLIQQDYNRGTTPIDIPQQPAKSYLDSYANYRNTVSILERPGAMLVQNGEIDTWKRLKRQEKAREESDEIRAALNYYTSNLNFDSDKIALTGNKTERSRLIREDRIPDVKTVITSDMGLRYLLRNDILTAMDDAKAELLYLMKQPSGDVDGKDLLDLLVTAQVACAKWFELIDEKDILAASEIARNEK
eukprot:scaffold26497_cov61-Cyclotella_meneghiniana.AAC.4